MPNYIYKCIECRLQKNFLMSISQYKSTNNEIVCDECGANGMTRVFGANNGIVELGPDEKLSQIREDARKIAKKIINGDGTLIRDVYGDKV